MGEGEDNQTLTAVPNWVWKKVRVNQWFFCCHVDKNGNFKFASEFKFYKKMSLTTL